MEAPWCEGDWVRFERETAEAARAERDAAAVRRALARAARRVLQTYSTSFFIVTRFLPAQKRADVELIYAAVRYPDEIVDTFPWTAEERHAALDRWSSDYERALGCATALQAIESGVNAFVAGFAEVVRQAGIPPEHYRAFLDAMRLDIAPPRYADLNDLIDRYVYGSAVVVGYFLAYVYGPSAPGEMSRALDASRDLGIALQLTNFLRDIREDRRRGRVYLPGDYLAAEGLTHADPEDLSSHPALMKVLRRLSATAEAHYAASERNLDAFASDCRVAIQACINVYRQLNRRIGRSPAGILHRESVPASEKFRQLPPSKYWRLPLAYMGAL